MTPIREYLTLVLDVTVLPGAFSLMPGSVGLTPHDVRAVLESFVVEGRRRLSYVGILVLVRILAEQQALAEQ